MRKLAQASIILLLTFFTAGTARSQSQSPAVAQPSANAANASPTLTSRASTPPSVAAPTAATPPQEVTFIQPEQPASLGDFARLARANKSAQPAKSVKIFDEANMPDAPVAAGEKAPGFSGATGSGNRVTVIDFWATWCGPCRHALPGLKQLQAAYGNNVNVVSVSEDEDLEAWHSFVNQNEMNWKQQIDSTHEIMHRFGANSLPTYAIIGKDGNVVQQYVGDQQDQSLTDRLGPDIQAAIAGKS